MQGEGKEADVTLDVAAWSGYSAEVLRNAASGVGRGSASGAHWEEKAAMAQISREAAQMGREGPMYGTTGDPREELAERAETLCRRLMDIEQALAVQEWWLLGRALPEARLLAEVASLLAVARGELENALGQFFGRQSARHEQTDQFTALGGPAPSEMNDPAWRAAQRDQAIHLLRLVASALPAMMQYAQLLQTHAERLGFPSAATDAFGIVVGRLEEAYDSLRQPPQ
jgi:hypothetical protein